MIILNSPNNPTGTVYTREELKELANLAVENNIYILSDEIYEKLLYDSAEHISIASFYNDIKELTIVVNGVSKSYAMTGWRLGYSAAAKEITQAMIKIQDHPTFNANSVAMMAALEALFGIQDSIIDICDKFKKRREFVMGSLKSIEGIRCNNPTGAFYAFPNIESYFGKQYKTIQ
jgi:aspartate aminotransferase